MKPDRRTALEQDLPEPLPGRFPPVKSLPDLFAKHIAKLDRDDGKARRSIEEAAVQIGIALANLVTASDPGTILVAVDDGDFLHAIEPVVR